MTGAKETIIGALEVCTDASETAQVVENELSRGNCSLPEMEVHSSSGQSESESESTEMPSITSSPSNSKRASGEGVTSLWKPKSVPSDMGVIITASSSEDTLSALSSTSGTVKGASVVPGVPIGEDAGEVSGIIVVTADSLGVRRLPISGSEDDAPDFAFIDVMNSSMVSPEPRGLGE